MNIILPIIIVGVIGLVAGVGLALASKFMAVPTDERVEKITEALPGANCGACGYSGCEGYAKAIASGEAEPDKCAPGGAAAAAEISEILGIELKTEKKFAFIGCNGTNETVKLKYEYEGLESCSAAVLLHSGPLDCAYGCMALGDCVKACPFGALTMVESKPTVCIDMCSGCGLCAKACPKKLIKILPENAQVKIGCSNKEKGVSVVKTCTVSCIACGMCEKACEAGALKMENNLPVIDYNLCTACGKCKTACKRKVII